MSRTDHRDELGNFITAKRLIRGPRLIRPHVVLLGAGASRAAFPDGNPHGFFVSLMDELMDALELRPLIEKAGLAIGDEKNFELVYPSLSSNAKFAPLAKEIEQRIHSYFSDLSLPREATIYDSLLISLRPVDAIFTFNWDPFLFDAYQRNRSAVPLPKIFFLHGNVRIGTCREHDSWGARDVSCSVCGRKLTDVPLFYPIEKKNYSADPYIRKSWDAAKILFSEAFTVTIFGYGAPSSDIDAIGLVHQAWMHRSDRKFEHVEIIDTADQSVLHTRWSHFTPTGHYRVTKTFDQSRIARWPRRSSEAVFYAMTQGLPSEAFPLPATNQLKELQSYAANIAEYEPAHTATSRK